MKGLYLNIPNVFDRLRRESGELGLPLTLSTATHGTDEIAISHHPQAWPEAPVHKDERAGATVTASGWLIYRGRLGDLKQLAGDLLAAGDDESQARVLAGIDAGAYLLLVCTPRERYLVTDPFGLHPHYYHGSDPFSALAPAPTYVRGPEEPDPLLMQTLETQDYLVGNLTAYTNVRRLEPGCIIRDRGRQSYASYTHGEWGPAATLERLRAALGFFSPLRPRILGVSGGLDSRLLLSQGTFDFGFTFGPPDTGDRPIARRFRECFHDYVEFSLHDVEHLCRRAGIARDWFDGICARPFVELLGVFASIHRRWGPGGFFFDGYIGDALQRALVLTSGGLYGSFAKLFPVLTMHRFHPHRLLRRRYRGVPSQVVDRIIDTYERKSAPWSVDAPRKMLLFEILHGRGARWALNGGGTLAGQYFPSIQPFAVPAVFQAFLGLDPSQALSYRGVAELWRCVDARFSRVPTYAGYRPAWPGHLSRATLLAVKGLGKKGLTKRARSYESELPGIQWR